MFNIKKIEQDIKTFESTHINISKISEFELRYIMDLYKKVTNNIILSLNSLT